MVKSVNPGAFRRQQAALKAAAIENAENETVEGIGTGEEVIDSEDSPVINGTLDEIVVPGTDNVDLNPAKGTDGVDVESTEDVSDTPVVLSDSVDSE